MSSSTDQHHINQTLNGDHQAFGKLVDRYQDMVFTLAIRIVKVREEAEEVAQDSFIKAYDALGTFRGDSKFSTWLYRITYRKALDHLRKMGRKQTMHLNEEVGSHQPEVLDNALQLMMVRERQAAVRSCIMKLPELDSTLVTLFYFEDMSIKEIAKITELSLDNVKVRLFRARKNLYNLLQHQVLPEIADSNGKAI